MASTLAAPRVLTALRAALAADATLTGMLATYNGGPAIFSEGDVPANAGYDRLQLGIVSEVGFNTMGSGLKWGSQLTVQVKVVSDKRNVDAGYAVLDRVLTLVDGTTLGVTGYGSAAWSLDISVEPFTELVGGVAYKHFPSLWRVWVHQGA